LAATALEEAAFLAGLFFLAVFPEEDVSEEFFSLAIRVTTS
jgi:hypothetical protein